MNYMSKAIINLYLISGIMFIFIGIGIILASEGLPYFWLLVGIGFIISISGVITTYIGLNYNKKFNNLWSKKQENQENDISNHK